MQKEFDSTFSRTIGIAAHRACGREGRFSIQCSNSVAFTHIIGPAIKSSKGVGPQTFRMGSVQSRLSYSLFFKLNEDVPDDNIYFQFSVVYTNWQHQCIMRVITHSLPTTGNLTKFLLSVNSDVASTLLAKKIVLLARKLDAMNDVLEHLDTTLRNIITGCGEKRNGTIIFPPELESIPRRLYLLRRGPMISPILQHPDDIDFLRCLFLNSNYPDSLRLVDPPLLLASLNGFEQLPPEDLALQSNFVLMLDVHTDIFIWFGKEVVNAKEIVEICKQHAQLVSSHRYPQPKVMAFEEGSSMARCLQCRLVPSHKDTLTNQVQSFPQLSQLSSEDYSKLLRKFHRTDEISYVQWKSANIS